MTSLVMSTSSDDDDMKEDATKQIEFETKFQKCSELINEDTAFSFASVRGELYRKNPKAPNKPWKKTLFILDGCELISYSDDRAGGETCIPLKHASVEGVFPPANNAAAGGSYHSFVIRWRAAGDASFDSRATEADWETVHVGHTEAALCSKWISGIKAAIAAASKPPQFVDFYENDAASIRITNNTQITFNSINPFAISNVNSNVNPNLWKVKQNVMKDLSDRRDKSWQLMHVHDYCRLFRSTSNPLKWKMETMVVGQQETILRVLLHPGCTVRMDEVDSTICWSHEECGDVASTVNAYTKHSTHPTDTSPLLSDVFIYQSAINAGIDISEAGPLQYLSGLHLKFEVQRYVERVSSDSVWIYATNNQKKNAGDTLWEQLWTMFGKQKKEVVLSVAVEYAGWHIQRHSIAPAPHTTISAVLCLTEADSQAGVYHLLSSTKQLLFIFKHTLIAPLNFFLHLKRLVQLFNDLQNAEFMQLSNHYKEEYPFLEVKEEVHQTKDEEIDGVLPTNAWKVDALLKLFAPLNNSSVDICRFLNAKNWKVDAAAYAILKWYQWRKKYRIPFLKQLYKPDDILNEYTQVIPVSSSTPYATVALEVHAAFFNHMKSSQQMNALLTYVAEATTSVASSQFTSDKVLVLINADKFAAATFRYDWFFEVLSAFQQFYPGRLGCLLVCNANINAKLVWLSLKPFISMKLRRKIVFVPPGVSPVSRLPSYYGDDLPKWCYQSTTEDPPYIKELHSQCTANSGLLHPI